MPRLLSNFFASRRVFGVLEIFVWWLPVGIFLGGDCLIFVYAFLTLVDKMEIFLWELLSADIFMFIVLLAALETK